MSTSPKPLNQDRLISPLIVISYTCFECRLIGCSTVDSPLPPAICYLHRDTPSTERRTFLVASRMHRSILTGHQPQDHSQGEHQHRQPFRTVHQDRPPVAAKTPGRPGDCQTTYDVRGETPGFMQVIKTEKTGVSHPIVLAKHAVRLGQQYAAE